MLPQIIQIRSDTTAYIDGLLAVFAEAFEMPDTYLGKPPDRAYLARLVEKETFIALCALSDDEVIGGLVAYELEKIEQAHSEIFVYDLAVLEQYRRQGIATALINRTREIATERNAWVVSVQAHQSNRSAVTVYSKLGHGDQVLNFDLSPLRVKGEP